MRWSMKGATPIALALLIGALAGWTIAQEATVPPKQPGAATAGPPAGIPDENVPDPPRGPARRGTWVSSEAPAPCRGLSPRTQQPASMSTPFRIRPGRLELSVALAERAAG